jgi:hypothetical protein
VKGKQPNKYIDVVCCICGVKTPTLISYLVWRLKRNPEYQPTCSINCRNKRLLKTRETCKVLKSRHASAKHDPSRLTANQIVDIICTSSPTVGAYISSYRETGASKQKTSSHHKGQLSKIESTRLCNLVRDGKASRYIQLFSMKDALEKAGLV